MTDSDLMPFGKHKGKKLGDVPADYLLWLYEQDWFLKSWGSLAGYVAQNYKALEMEVRDRQHEAGDRYED